MKDMNWNDVLIQESGNKKNGIAIVMRFKMMPASRKTVIRIYIAARDRRPTRSSRGHDGDKSCSQLAARGKSISRAGSGSTRCLCSINFSRQLESSIYCFVSGAPTLIRKRILPRPLVAVREDKRRAKNYIRSCDRISPILKIYMWEKLRKLRRK